MSRAKLCGFFVRVIMWIDPGFMPRLAIEVTDRIDPGFKRYYDAERHSSMSSGV